MNKINLELTIEEANLILKALGDLPYIQVHELIHNIKRQAALQLEGPGPNVPAQAIAQAQPATE